MSSGRRKQLLWSIRKKLHQLTASEAHLIATSLGGVEGLDSGQLSLDDEESCVEYITNYMTCQTVLDREDQGLLLLHRLECIIDGAIGSRSQGSASPQVEASTSKQAGHPAQPPGGATDTDLEVLLRHYKDIQVQLDQTPPVSSDPERWHQPQATTSHSLNQLETQLQVASTKQGPLFPTCGPTHLLISPQQSPAHPESAPSRTGDSMIAVKGLTTSVS